MKNHSKSAVIALVVMMVLSSCQDYSGDGELVDHGFLDTNRRYTLELGSLKLGASEAKEFRLVGLPGTWFVVGVSLTQDHPFEGLEDSKPLVGALAVRLTREGGEVVIEEEAPLSDWIWSHGAGSTKVFLYRRGEEQEHKMSDGSFRLERIGVKIDDGWGTYFTPAPKASYTLSVSLRSEGSSTISAKLVAQASGWK